MNSELNLRFEYEIGQQDRFEKKFLKKEEDCNRRTRRSCISPAIEEGTCRGLEDEVVHGKVGRGLEDIDVYDVEAEAKYTDAIKDLEKFSFPRQESLEACKDYGIEFFMSLLILEEIHGKEDHLDHDIPLFEAIAASQARADEKRKKDVSLNMVVEVVDDIWPSSLALNTETPISETMLITNYAPVSFATPKAGTVVLVQVVNPVKPALEITTDNSSFTVVASQEPSIVVIDY
ncbi:hypothetical protein Tco_0659340 [Tanacetum coccineum]|uniref:Uncharacterized protein n=1 Tax=Tanacetum coccineum TaxID=301880 RepID=A0ABQ4WQX2_9ASTR